jgi:hypothetical protein
MQEILIALWIVLIVNLVLTGTILIFIGSFLVRMKNRIEFLFSQLISDFIKLAEEPIPIIDDEPKAETWDEKYEREIDMIQKRLRADSGLVSLPDPQVSWGQPPAENPANMKDLIVKEI